MAKERTIRTLYRDPHAALIGGVCAGIAETLEADVLLVRVAAIVSCVMTLGLVIALYLVFWTILPVKPAKRAFVEVEPSRVRSEYYNKVVTLRSDKAQPYNPELKVFEQDTGAALRAQAGEKTQKSSRFPLVMLAILLIATTLIIFCAVAFMPTTNFATFIPLYWIPLGIYFMAFPKEHRSFAMRVCIMLLCFEACFVMMPFALGIYGFQSFAYQRNPTFIAWIVAFIFLLAAIIFERTSLYAIAASLVFIAAISLFNDFGLFESLKYFSFDDLKSFAALGLSLRSPGMM